MPASDGAAGRLRPGALPGLLDVAPDGLLVVDGAGVIVYANATAEALSGYARGALVGASVESLVPAALRDAHRDHRAGYARTWQARPMGPDLDLALLRADGTERAVDVSLAPIRLDGAPMVMVAVRDATEHRRAECERSELASRLERGRERERIAGDLHDDVIQSVYAVGLDLQAARFDRALSKDQVIDRAIAELKGVISDLRAYMDYLRGAHAGAEPADGDLFAVRLESLLHTYASGPRWHTAFALNRPLEDRMARELFLVAKELISNTVRHANAEDAWIALRCVGDCFELRVADDGVGFDPCEEHEGSFGLQNLRQRLDGLDAELAIESAPGEGTLVRVRVPVRGPEKRPTD